MSPRHSSFASPVQVHRSLPRHSVKQRRRVRCACLEALEHRRLLSLLPAVNYQVGAGPQAVVTMDFNRDGRLDLVTSNPSDFNISVLLGNGQGGFGAAVHFDTWPTTEPPGWLADYTERDASLVIADFNEDGKLDVATVHRYRDPDTGYGDGYLSLFLGNGDGTFQTATSPDSGFGSAEAAAAGDFNGDGHIDLLVGADDWNDSLGQVRVLRGNGRGGFTRGPDWRVNYPPDAVVAYDIYGDGKLDAIVLSGNIWLLLGNGDGTFGHMDEIGIDPGGLDLALLEGFGLVVVGETLSIPSDHAPNGSMHTGVASGDFNGDGKPDVVTSDGDTGTVSLLLGNGDGTVRYIGAFAIGSSPSAVAVGDFNGDGRPDVAATNAGSNNVSVLLNDGVWAGTKTFVGPGGAGSGGNWSTGSNWSPPGVPGAGDVVTIAGKSVTLAANMTVGGLNLLGGATLTLGANGGRVLRASSLSISANSKLNLADNDLLIDYTGATPYATIRGYVVNGRNTGTGGIVTTNTADTALAVADNALLGRTSWSGQSIDASTIIGKYTFLGDANLDGRVTTDDYVAVDLGLGRTNAQWIQGDMDFTGAVTTDDYVVIDLNLGKGTSNPLAFADDQEAMTALQADQFGESYVKAVEQAAKQNCKFEVTKRHGGKKR